MKKILGSFLIIILSFMLITFNININAATGDVYNIVTCPGEDMATQMQINWQSTTSITGLKIEYTEQSDESFSKSLTVEGKYRSFSRQDNEPFEGTVYVGFSTPRYVWNVSLNNLTPKTKYMYRIVKDGKVYSDIHKFETASKDDDEFSFLFMTDPQYYDEDGAKVFNKMTEKHITDSDIKFTFITGDISDKGGNSTYWDMFYTKSSLKKVPFATTVGNHDYYDSKTVRTNNFIFNHFFYNPQNGPENVKGSSYYFVYNQALFIMLDSEEKYNIPETKEWFKKVCETVKCSYIIVGCHRSAYAAGPYVSLGKQFIAEWGPIFDECQVDLVLSGHDHVFTRTKKLVNGEVTTEKNKGTVYIEGGAAGVKYYAIVSRENEDKWAAVVEKKICSTVITLGKDSYKTKTYSSSGTLLDSSEVERKRFGNYDETYTKEEFEKSIKIERNENDLRSGTISWSSKGYGHVSSVSIKHVNSGKNLGKMFLVNEYCTSLKVYKQLAAGEINNFEIVITYWDGTSKKIELLFDNRIDWGEIYSINPIDISATSFNLLVKYKLNPEYDYIDVIRIRENGVLKKNFYIKSEHLLLDEVVVEMSKKFIEPETTHTYLIEVIDINGISIWTEEIVITSKREMSEEEIYQNEMANIAFKSMIENLLKALELYNE